MPASLIDTDTLSEIIKGCDAHVLKNAADYLATNGRFSFSIITRYEVLWGLRAKEAAKQIALFEQRCRMSNVLPLSDDVVDVASGIYGDLYRTGNLISDADILIAATALVNKMDLVTENPDHFRRIKGLHIESWRRSP